jgi:hypothetical protein
MRIRRRRRAPRLPLQVRVITKTGRSLGAILISPPFGTGARTIKNLGVAAGLLDCSDVHIGNLFPLATANSPSVGLAGTEWDSWLPAQERLSAVLADCDELLFAWGVSVQRSPAKDHFERQVRWVHQEAARFAHHSAWIVGDGPRHPSRWQQFVSDRHQRTNGGTFEARLRDVLHSVAISSIGERRY